MDSVGKALTFVKDAVVFVMTELRQLDRMNQFISTNILTYEVAINNLLDTIQRLSDPLYSEIVNQSTLSSILGLVNAHVLSLQKLVVRMTKWNNHIKAGGFKRIRALIRGRPSVLAEILFTKLLEIKPLLFEICEIERIFLGSGVRIRNPLLRASWVLSGMNQVNDSSIDRNIIVENMYVLLKKEMGGEIRKPQIWKQAIHRLVDQIDGCAAGDPDRFISVSELNEFHISSDKTSFRQILKEYIAPGESSGEPRSPSSQQEILLLLPPPDSSIGAPVDSPVGEPIGSQENSSEGTPVSPEAILSIENGSPNGSRSGSEIDHQEHQVEEDIQNISLNFKPVTIRHNHSVEIPKCEGYGSNWPSVQIAEFTIPESKYPHLEFDFVEILCDASDQGWGNTGHDNVRYQINEEPIQVGFFIDRNKYPDNRYRVTLNYEKLRIGDRVLMWLSCAPWSGFEARIDDVEVRVTYG